MNKRRIVVTGLGIVSALGKDVPSTWSAILKSQSGITPIEHFDASVLPCQFSGSIKDFSLASFKTRHLSKMDLSIQYAMHAAREAVIDANLEDSNLNLQRIGVSIGSGIGGLTLIEKQHLNLMKATQSNISPLRTISPFFIPGTIINMASGICSIEYGFKGPNLAVVTACTTGTHNIGLGARTIAYGDADVMVVGGTEMGSTPLSIAGFSACRALSTYNENPVKASRPWDQKRDGFVLADGASILILEAYEHAKARGAKIYAELVGFGMSADAYDMTSPEPTGKGAQQAMQNALHDAGMQPDAIDYINAHATSTKLGDIAEILAIEEIFGEHSRRLKISATKSMTGHLLGASGAIEAIFSILAIRDQVAPPTINLDQPESICEGLNLVPHQAQPSHINTVLSNSFGFGGTNGSLIFKKL